MGCGTVQKQSASLIRNTGSGCDPSDRCLDDTRSPRQGHTDWHPRNWLVEVRQTQGGELIVRSSPQTTEEPGQTGLQRTRFERILAHASKHLTLLA
eukprot:scaffold1386_cov342-Pavlova_lutheri.AAC.16